METVKRNSNNIKLVQIHPLVNLQEKTDQSIKLRQGYQFCSNTQHLHVCVTLSMPLT